MRNTRFVIDQEEGEEQRQQTIEEQYDPANHRWVERNHTLMFPPWQVCAAHAYARTYVRSTLPSTADHSCEVLIREF